MSMEYGAAKEHDERVKEALAQKISPLHKATKKPEDKSAPKNEEQK